MSRSVMDGMAGFDVPERLAVCSSLMTLILFEAGLIHNREAVEMALSIMDQCVKSYGDTLSRTAH